MSVARGILTGFLKEGLEQKAARDEMYADMVKETGQEFRKTAQLFRKEEENTEKRFKLLEEELGTPAALYASYNGLTTSDDGYNLMLKAPKDFLDKLKDFNFQGYGYNTAKTSRAMDFKKQVKDSKDLIIKNQGSGPVADLYLKDLESMDTGTEVARPELDLPKMSEFSGGSTAISSKDMMAYRKAAFAEFKAVEKDEFIKEFKDNFSKDYDPEKHGPSKDLYGFERYFNEFYLPGIVGNKQSKTMDTQMQTMTGTGTTTETGTATEDAQTTGTAPQITEFNVDNTFTYDGKLYNKPERFKTQSIPEVTKKALASQQDNEAPNKNNPNVLSAQRTIDIIRSQNPNDPRIDDIKRDLRLILGVTNLDGLIS